MIAKYTNHSNVMSSKIFKTDTEERVITPPVDLVKALKAMPPAWERWRELSYSHRREYVDAIEEAKAPDTRAPHRSRGAGNPDDTEAKAAVTAARARLANSDSR